VKIKINGQEKSYGNGKKKKKRYKQEGQPDKQKDTPPVQREEVHNQFEEEEERPIIIVDEAAAAAEKKEEEEFEWVLPKEPEKQQEASGKTSYIEDLRQLNKDKETKARPAPFGKKKKLAPPSFSKQLFLSIGMAVGIGTCLGFLILAVMNMSDNPINPDVPAVAPVTPDNGNNPSDETPAASGEGSVTMASQTISVLQAGAFSTAEGANAEIDRLKTAGFSGVAVGSDPTYVLMAVGQNVDGMKQIAGLAQGKGFEPYAKDLTLTEKTVRSLTEQDVLIVQEGQTLYNLLAAAVSALLQGNSLDGASKESLEVSYNKVAAIKEEELSDATKQWKASLVGAYEILQSNQGGGSSPALWDAQQKLLEATVFLY
jgi:hypothetical protein